MKGRNPMVGRHNVGGRTGSAGKIRSGQSEPAGNKPITSSSYNTTPKPGVLNDAKETSLDLQKRISGRAPQPFANKQGAATTPTPASPRGAKPGGESVANPRGVYSGKSGSSVGQSNPSGTATGYSKLPNQSKQIGGRMGFPPPARKAGSFPSGFKAKRNAAFYGEN